MADLDGDGKDEIYISATDGLYVSSLIMKYDSPGGFQIVSRNISWYLRHCLFLEKVGSLWDRRGEWKRLI